MWNMKTKDDTQWFWISLCLSTRTMLAMVKHTQTRWIAAPSYEKAAEFAVKRAKDLATTYPKGVEMLDKAKKRGAKGWTLYEIRFIIEVDETQ